MNNETLLPPQCGKYPSFLPYKLCEAPQYAPYRPATAIPPTESTAPDIPHSTEGADAARTKKPQKAKKTGRGAPKKVLDNSLKPYLQGFNHPGHALSRLPQFDHIVTGAVSMDFGGNTRPLSKKLVITLLRRLNVISAEAVEAYMHASMRQCTLRHAQKIAQVLRVIIHAAAKVAEAQWPAPGEAVDQHTFGSADYITPCGSDTCTICSGSPQPHWDWPHHGANDDDVVDDCIELGM
jgi:hypothetical protein